MNKSITYYISIIYIIIPIDSLVKKNISVFAFFSQFF